MKNPYVEKLLALLVDAARPCVEEWLGEFPNANDTYATTINMAMAGIALLQPGAVVGCDRLSNIATVFVPSFSTLVPRPSDARMTIAIRANHLTDIPRELADSLMNTLTQGTNNEND
jgi:hypothetical protein